MLIFEYRFSCGIAFHFNKNNHSVQSHTPIKYYASDLKPCMLNIK